tara:strand:+ start:317 stop:787 length:471 start_codon:yes stop_codon:yes gene_type:complete
MNLNKEFSWQLNKELLYAILNDNVSDRFVSELIWERLFYARENNSDHWIMSDRTPLYWREKFPSAPQIIAERRASVHLTRSIDKDHKQCLKEFLNFKGYKLNELYPRKTRRATAVNWLIYWSKKSLIIINDTGKMPDLQTPPFNQALGHKNDLPIS